jgi:hypothetical protein
MARDPDSLGRFVGSNDRKITRVVELLADI